MWVNWSSLREKAVGAQRTVDLICRDLNVFLSFHPGLLRRVIPGFLCTLEEVESTHDICGNEDLRICNRTVHMRLGCKINYVIRVILLDKRGNELSIADIAVDEHMPFIVF